MFKVFEKYGKLPHIILLGSTSIVFILSLFVNYFNAKGVFFDNVVSISEMSDKYLTLITPAKYTFGIWGLIYSLAFVLLFIWWKMLFNSESFFDDQHYSITAFLFISILNPLWILVWTQEKILLSWIVMLCLLVVIIFVVMKMNHSNYVPIVSRIFFNIYLGWISVAFSVNTAVLLISQGMFTDQKTAVILTISLLVIITLLATYALLFKNNWAYLLVIIWAFIGILSQLNNVGGYSHLVFILVLLISVLALCAVYCIFNMMKKDNL